jgi:hypothetical protein
MKKIILISLIFLVVGLLFNRAESYVSESTNYRLQKDSLNFGGILSSSPNYQLEDTLGEVGTGIITSANYVFAGGYQAMDSDSYVSLSGPTTIDLSPALDSDDGGQANGSGVWSVTTNNSAGYSLSIKANSLPALSSGSNSFTDYSPITVNPDFSWSVATTDSSFGFSVVGNDIVNRFIDDGSVCNAGSNQTTDSCWDGFDTTGKTIATAGVANAPTGIDTTVSLRAEIGADKNQPAGNYEAILTITAIAL